MKRSPEAFRSPHFFQSGLGYVVVCRYKGDGRCEAGIFLIDALCLGVKDGDFASFGSVAEFEEVVFNRLFHDAEPVRMTAPAARKLIEGAVAYARGLGFVPGADFKKASRVLGGITTAGCDEEFAFGTDGKPFYIQGPNDSAARALWILQTLERHCGAGGYDFILAPGSDEFDARGRDEEEGWSEVATHLDSEVSIGLHEMARRAQAERPGTEVLLNPAGRPNISDRLALMAEPLLETAPDVSRDVDFTGG